MRKASLSNIGLFIFFISTTSALANSNDSNKVIAIAKVGTLGFGIEAIKPIAKNLELHASINHLNLSHSAKFRKVNYDTDIKLQTMALRTNWHPYESDFFLSAGALFNKSRLEAQGIKTNKVRVGNNIFSGNSQFNMSIKFKPVSSYFGVGYRKNLFKKGFSVLAEAGIVLQTSPTVKLSVKTPKAANVTQNDIAIERQRIEHDLKKIENWPVFSVGITYQF